jgi:hypothetical protein
LDVPGFPEGVHRKGGAAAAITHRELCRQADAEVAPLIVELRGQGLSLRAIAAELTRRRLPTRQGFGTWHARQVARILGRAAGASQVAETPPAAPTDTLIC